MRHVCMFKLCDYVTTIYSTQVSASGLVSVTSASHGRQYCVLQFTDTQSCIIEDRNTLRQKSQKVLEFQPLA